MLKTTGARKGEFSLLQGGRGLGRGRALERGNSNRYLEGLSFFSRENRQKDGEVRMLKGAFMEGRQVEEVQT